MFSVFFWIWITGVPIAGSIKTTWVLATPQVKREYVGISIVCVSLCWPLFFFYGGIKQLKAEWD